MVVQWRKDPAASAEVQGFDPGQLKFLGATKQLSAVTIEPVLWSPATTTAERKCCNCQSPVHVGLCSTAREATTLGKVLKQQRSEHNQKP